MAALPAPRTPGRYRVVLVCLGNICRSPLADVVLADRIARSPLAGAVEVASGGTADWHVGKPMDERSAAVLTEHGLDPSAHGAQQVDGSWAERHDLLLAMDAANLADLGGASERVRLFRDFDPDGPGEVPDPYYGGEDGFREVYAMVDRTCAALVEELTRTLDDDREGARG